tara:strand:- start:344 stop:1462 length:1119 start_codon:yes stop_codon:yes gene_type:complete
MIKNYAYCILGAGLAGLSLAKSLKKVSNCSILIIDPNGIAGGASGSPIGLVNPATGRYANQTWNAEVAVETVKSNLEEISASTTKKFFKKTGIIRPAMDQKIARRMQENLESTDWPKNWVRWLSVNELENKFPKLENTDGGLWVKEGFTVAIPNYLTALADFLKEKDVDIIEHKSFELNKPDSSPDEFQNWSISFSDESTTIKAKNLIVTAGIKTKDFDFLKDLPLIPVKGQVSVYECEDEFPYDAAVSALGYFATLDGKTFVAGSTYEHKFEYEEPDDFGVEYISNRLLKVMPHLKGRIKLIDQWSGIRASTPDRMPIVGHHPDIRNCFVFAGLGSKGLLYSGFLSNIISLYFKNQGLIPDEVSIDRFSKG